ncbi:Soluble pyridine nucleotide transhydrogenase [Seminavis robusta]|uniref:NAD(P)(+) transhydrogenase (Si-specific) n=1 Tax=Seminavis robusta TaxID=568900 RepID=A0A9N8H6M0_9STRA|nr:Soluble pyridine nucleotide transhydrogenase [Seminavis robusta]|eukprot:Sro175_g077070.1 Soluble pyridine nucleotide transhydrogenase (694) ;mRNA; r:55980-58290
MKVNLSLALSLTTFPWAEAWSPSPMFMPSLSFQRHRGATLTLRIQASAMGVEENKSSQLDQVKDKVNGQEFVNLREFGSVNLENLEKLYDLVVIGGGPAGVAGAVQAAQMGQRAIIIDRPKAPPLANGLDLFFGAPTGLFSKALRDCSKTLNLAAMRAQGFDDDVIWKQVENTVVRLAQRNSEGQVDLLKSLRIDYLQGEATLLSQDHPADQHDDEEEEETFQPRNILIKKAPIQGSDGIIKEDQQTTITGAKVLLATGSKATRFNGIPFDDKRIFESDSINRLGFLPNSVVIGGAGIIAIEFANIFKNLGVDVTMLIRGTLADSAKKLGVDPDVTDELIRLLIDSGVQIKEGASVEEFESVPSADAAQGETDGKVVMKLTDGTKLESDIFLAAYGRSANGKEVDTGLDSAGVDVSDRGEICITEKDSLGTSSPNVAAAGDCVGWPMLASSSMEQAVHAVEHMFDSKKAGQPLDFATDMSIGIWTIPEIGYFGMTKEAAAERGIKVIEGVATFDKCLRGRVFDPDGLLKLVVDADSGRIVGVHIIGKDAAEMVHYGMSLVRSKNTIYDLMTTMFTAVTFHELFKEAALAANQQLDFGVEWQKIFEDLSDACPIDPETGEALETTMEELRETFDKLDDDGSGALDEEELRALFISVGRKPRKRTISNLIRLADLDGDGVIDWEEFKLIWDRIQC